jgi:hypothetical protein
MSSEPRCEEIRELAPELALGIAEARERARALEHLASCTECTGYVAELSDLADDLLLLSPSEEPPIGFEARALESFRPVRPPRRRPIWRLAAVSAATAALATAAAMFLVYRDDHRLASDYRSTLAEANGKYFDAEALSAPGGAEVGQVFGYQGSPSWVLVTVNSPEPMPSGDYDLQLITAGGRTIALRKLRIDHGTGSSGQAIPIPFYHVAEVRVLGPGRGDVYEARIPANHSD